MVYMLFAANKYYPRGGIEDLVGLFESLNDQTIMDAVLLQVDKYGSDEKLYASDILVNAVFLENGKFNEPSYWKLCFANSTDDEKLRFASVTSVTAAFGACGLIPLTRVKTQLEGDDTYTLEYCTLDPSKTMR